MGTINLMAHTAEGTIDGRVFCASLMSLHDESVLLALEWKEASKVHFFREKHELVAAKRKLHQEFWSA